MIADGFNVNNLNFFPTKFNFFLAEPEFFLTELKYFPLELKYLIEVLVFEYVLIYESVFLSSNPPIRFNFPHSGGKRNTRG